MECSRLPLPSLLGLFGALLMLPPELLLEIPKDSPNCPETILGVGKALAFAVAQYNHDRRDSINYFKVLWAQQALIEMETSVEYNLLTQLVKTKCKKTASLKLSYKDLQKCQRLPGKAEKPICSFKVRQVFSNMELEAKSCT